MKKRFPLRMPEALYNELKTKSDLKGISMNALILNMIQHEDLGLTNTEFDVYLGEIHSKLDEIKDQREEIRFTRELLIAKASKEHKRNERLEERVMASLTTTPQSELRIADEIGEDVNVVFFVLSYLFQEGQIQQKEGKWFASK